MIKALIQMEIRSIFRDAHGWGGSLGFMVLASVFLMIPMAPGAAPFPAVPLFWSLICLSLFLQLGSIFEDDARWGGIDFLVQTPAAFGMWVFIKIASLSIWNVAVLGMATPVCFLFLGIDLTGVLGAVRGMVFLFPIIISLMALIARLCLSCRLPIFMRPLLVGPLIIPFLLFVQYDTDPFGQMMLMGSALGIPPLCTLLIDGIHRRLGG